MAVSRWLLIKGALRVVVLTPLIVVLTAVSMDMRGLAELTTDGVTLGDVTEFLGVIPYFPLVVVGAAVLAFFLPYVPNDRRHR